MHSEKYERLGNCAWRINLIEFLCTLMSDSLLSPVEILNQRVYKGFQPFLCDNPTLNCRSEMTTDNLTERKREEKLYHDRYKSVSEKPIIPEGQNICYRNHVKEHMGEGFCCRQGQHFR